MAQTPQHAVPGGDVARAAGPVSRRELLRRAFLFAGGAVSSATLLTTLGCTPSLQTAPTTAAVPTAPPKPTAPAQPAAAQSPAAAKVAASPVPGSRSPLSVPADDAAIEAQEITLQSGGATIMAYQARPRGASGPLPLVLVCHENRGLTDHIRDVTRRFAREGYVACAVDLLSREGGTASGANPSQLSRADQLRHVGDFQAAVDYYKTQGRIARTDRIGMTGYCFGGAVTWRAATRIRDLTAAAPFYGSAPPLDEVPNMQAAVLGVFAERDQRINQGIEPLRAALQQAGKEVEIKVYPGTGHGFHNDTGGAYNQEQAHAAWRDTLAWFERHLKA